MSANANTEIIDTGVGSEYLETGRGEGTPVLQVRDLHVRFPTEAGSVHAVRGVDFDLYPGRVLGIVGESGSGKSVTSLSIMGLLPDSAKVTGSIKLEGQELLGLSDRQMGRYRGKDMAMVFQDPLSSLTPVFSIGKQITDALLIHQNLSKSQAEKRAVELLDLVGIPSPKERVKNFPHEFSGGMRQRVMIAIAMANDPKVIIADEPTTALDVTIQAQVLEVLKAAQRETGAAVVMITHDLGVVAGVADDMIVMYAGKPVERGSVDDIYYQPRMPYTMGLLGSIPRVDRAEKTSLIPIEGNPPNLIKEPVGCSFADRCPLATAECRTAEPELVKVGENHLAACIKTDDFVGGVNVREIYHAPPKAVSKFEQIPRTERQEVLALKDVKKYFPLTRGALVKRRIGTVKAVDGLTLDIREGECLSIVGESGCGKTTTLLEIMEFRNSQPGEIIVNGISTKTKSSGAERQKMRREMQMVFQDPMGALDPRFTVFEILSEPMRTHGFSSAEIKKRTFELMKTVGLQPDHVNRFPNQFSGGQRQRIGIARALAVNPKLVVLDEPVSALDVSIQAGVINLLDKLRAELGLSYLMVAHDLSVVRHISDRVAVMYLGKIVEHGPVDEVFDNPKHPYTRSLLSAIPIPDPKQEKARERIILHGDLPSPLEARKGCNFATRCPVFAALPAEKQQRCLEIEPELEPNDSVQEFACHFPEGKLAADTLVGSH
ncbi:ABC transporter ATP-binding protein [Psychromicrobium lacuslunae]|uniref:ABC transporter ATP-binding protein n=1 Tax=Psychromicrobium lacuslunae TaxID=1618207 RepID=UPI0005D32ABA|nr:ABC transporter ATP-binding protein [Psychromicrobium lacuslunae]